MAGKTYEFNLSDYGLLSRQILTALQQSTDSHGGGGDTSRRIKLDRTLGPFIYANFPLFPELSDCIDLSAYGKPVVLDNTLYLRVEAINPPVAMTKGNQSKGRRQSAAQGYYPKTPRGPHADRFSSPRSEKLHRIQSFPANFPEDRSPYPQSPSQQRSGAHDLFLTRPPSPRDQQHPTRFPRPRSGSVEREEHRHRPPPFRQDSNRVAPVAPMGPRYQ